MESETRRSGAIAAPDVKTAAEKAFLERIVAEHAGLVKSVALRFSRAYPAEAEDLIQIGYIGLLKAARRFDPERGLAFSTYAVPMIAGEIRSQLRDQGSLKVSRSIKADITAVRRAENAFLTAHGVSPKISELAEASGLSAERVAQALAAADHMQHFEEYDSLHLCGDEEEKNIDRIDLAAGIASLSARQRQVIILRYYKDFTQQQIADILGISQVQVCRIEKKTLQELERRVSIGDDFGNSCKKSVKNR